MSQIFITILNMSLMASYCIIAVIVLRLFLRKQSKLFSYLLWSVVLFRLLCPFSISSSYSLLRMDTDVISKENIDKWSAGNVGGTEHIIIEHPETMAQQMGTDSANNIDTTGVRTGFMADAKDGRAQTWIQKIRSQVQKALYMASWVWLAGIILLIGYSLVTAFRLKHKLTQLVKTTVRESSCVDEYFSVDGITTPFVFGILNPRIYLPTQIQEEEKKYVLEHEKVHIARKDYLIKILAYSAACIHWFNPLVWLAFVLMENDMEMSCDEAVLKKLGADIRKEYSLSLLSFSTEGIALQGSPLAFGEGNVKERVKNIMSYRKKTVIGVVVAAVLLIVAVVGLALNPSKQSDLMPLAAEGVDDTEIVTESELEEQVEIKKEELAHMEEELTRMSETNADLSQEMQEKQAALDEMNNRLIELEELKQELQLTNTELAKQVELAKWAEQVDADKLDELIVFVENYAAAFADRDGSAMVDLYIDEDTALANVFLLEKAGGSYTMGVSSPMVYSFEYQLIPEENKVYIYYFAWVSDPHVSVWKEEVQYTRIDGEYRATKSSLSFLDSISSKEEFDEAYLINGEYKFVDYQEAGFVDAINYQRKDGTSAVDNTVYEEPGTAAEHILNLTGGKIIIDDRKDGYQKMVRYVFADGSEIMLPMYQANYKKSGNDWKSVWIVDTAVWNAGAP